jgi:hypothetical protein
MVRYCVGTESFAFSTNDNRDSKLLGSSNEKSKTPPNGQTTSNTILKKITNILQNVRFKRNVPKRSPLCNGDASIIRKCGTFFCGT